ncbi:MAG: chromosomal replication initiator protein DnaA [Hyphomicrobiales bacterium]
MPVTTPATPSSFVDDASQEDPQEIWQRISARLRSELGEDVFTSWFLRVELESLSGGVVTLSAATRFLRNWIMSHFKEKLTGFWEDEVGTVHRLDIRVRGALRARAGQNAQAGKSDSHTNNDGKPASARRLADMRDNPSHVGDARGTTYETGTRNTFKQSGNMSSVAAVRSGTPLSLVQSLGSALDRRYVFDSFCSGAANKVAFEAARSVAMALPGAPVLYNPLYLHGSVGLGKTHLLQAIANQAASTGARQVVYLTAERFMANFVQALRSERALQFKEQLRAIDLLLIDDMQFLTGKAIQQEFCHMLNALIDGGKQVVVAADRPASELDALEERVRSRLQGGAAVQIGAPDTQLRRDILTRRCETIVTNHPDISITDTVLDYVANLITTNGRDLDGALNRLVCHAQMSREPVTIGVAEQALNDLVGRREPRKVRIEDIQKIVSQHYNVSRSDMLSARRTRTIVLPRQIAMYIAKNVTPRSLPEIGRRFGNRDHTTVLHAVRKIEGLLQTDKKLGQEIELLRRLVEE